MIILDHFQQGSMAWLEARVGRITMSRAKDLLTGGKGKTRQSYILDVAAEKLSGEPVEGYTSIDMERGTFLEPWAVKAFEAATGMQVAPVGFVIGDDERIGCSPDGLLGHDAGLEIKSPKPRQHLRNIFGDGMDEYAPQAQGGMWLTGRDCWFVVSFCPWVKQYPLHIRLLKRDEDVIAKLAESATKAADEVDEICARAVSEHSLSNRVFDVADRAAQAWGNVFADSSEVQL